MKMNRITIAVLPLLFSAAAAFAQAPESSIRESTDPARIAEIERRAQELRSGQPSMGAGSQGRMPIPMADDRRPPGPDGMRHHGPRRGAHHGPHHGHHPMRGDHPKAVPGAGK